MNNELIEILITSYASSTAITIPGQTGVMFSMYNPGGRGGGTGGPKFGSKHD
jgi:hypothetical protein